MVLKDKLTILVCSCDAYADLWDPFFKLFDVYGGELKSCPILLNTEGKSYRYEGLKIMTLGNGQARPWGQRLREHLDAVETPYVLFLLDDFFLRADVNIDLIQKCVERMDADEEVACFNLIPLYGSVIPSERYPEFNVSDRTLDYRINAQAALWRKEDLKATVLDCESPWDWEVYGNIRNSYIFNKQIYHLSERICEPLNYPYRYDKNGIAANGCKWSAIYRGKWNVKEVREVFAANGIDVDFSLRGEIRDGWDYHSSFLYRGLRKLMRPLRKKQLAEKERRDREKYDRLVAPYIR